MIDVVHALPRLAITCCFAAVVVALMGVLYMHWRQ
jgi:hypothetical protein